MMVCYPVARPVIEKHSAGFNIFLISRLQAMDNPP